MPKFTAREAIARSYPSYDYEKADRLIAWLESCGYRIIDKHLSPHEDVSLAPSYSEERSHWEHARSH